MLYIVWRLQCFASSKSLSQSIFYAAELYWRFSMKNSPNFQWQLKLFTEQYNTLRPTCKLITSSPLTTDHQIDWNRIEPSPFIRETFDVIRLPFSSLGSVVTIYHNHITFCIAFFFNNSYEASKYLQFM